MILLFDIGNTHTHLGLADAKRVRKRSDMLTAAWFDNRGRAWVRKFVGNQPLEGAALCSVVPRATSLARRTAEGLFRNAPTRRAAVRGRRRQPFSGRKPPTHVGGYEGESPLGALAVECLELTPRTVWGVGIDYPKPDTIGPDRLANAVAARHAYGTPVVVVDFGTE